MTVLDVCASRYTGKDRDPKTGFDYFGARYYSSSMGRFTSPDWSNKPVAIPYADLTTPQSLNLYQYEGNNPLLKAEKDGHCWPVCTILAGAAVGAVTGAAVEAGTEYFSTGKVDANKVENAALGGFVTGAIIGAAGPEAGLAAKTILGATAAAVGGAVERGTNGEKVDDVKAVVGDAVAGAISLNVDAVADKTFLTEAIAKAVPKLIDATIDAGKRLADGDGKELAPQTRPCEAGTGCE